MSTTKKKFKRDYIILEAKDMNFRLKERATPKAFAKVEINEDKSTVALYVENVKFVKEGYKVIVMESDYSVREIGRVIVNQQGKGEFVLNLNDEDIEVKAVALTYERKVPLIGFKGAKIDNYEDLLFIEEEYEEYEEDEEEYEEEESEEFEEEYEEENEEVEEYEDYREKKKEEEQEIEREEYDKYHEYKEYKVEQSREEHEKDYNESQSNEEYNSETRNSRPYLMPRKIKKVLKKYKECKPFTQDVIRDTRWWKMDINPTTLCNYSVPCLGYVNYLNYTMYSDCVMNSYKYRHYIFGVQYDEYGRRKYYIYGIPGTKDEQPDQGFTGFYKYIPCNCKDSKLGYWLCFIDARTRTIYYE